MDKTVEKLNLGYKLQNKRFSIICYADDADAAIMAETEDDLYKQIYHFRQTAKIKDQSL